jgi:hypothetical protein
VSKGSLKCAPYHVYSCDSRHVDSLFVDYYDALGFYLSDYD